MVWITHNAHNRKGNELSWKTDHPIIPNKINHKIPMGMDNRNNLMDSHSSLTDNSSRMDNHSSLTDNNRRMDSSPMDNRNSRMDNNPTDNHSSRMVNPHMDNSPTVSSRMDNLMARRPMAICSRAIHSPPSPF
jgi:hypothetical protein